MINYLYCDKGYVDIEEWREGGWVSMTAPTQVELEELRDRFDVPADFMEDIEDIDERPRIEKNGEWVLAILRIPIAVNAGTEDYCTVPVGIMVRHDVIITVCHFANEMLPDFIDHSRRRSIDISSPYDFILRLLNSSAYWFLRYLKDIRVKGAEAEKKLKQSIRNSDLLQLLRMQKVLVLFATSLKGNLLLLERIQRLSSNDIDIDIELLEDVDIELRQADTTVEVTTAMLDRTLDTYANVISNNVNAIMKRLTSISVILMVPTLIASFYGMNVNVGIAMGNTAAFWVIVGVAAVLSIITCLWLKIIKWL